MSKPYLLMEATYKQLKQERPQLAVLPWGCDRGPWIASSVRDGCD